MITEIREIEEVVNQDRSQEAEGINEISEHERIIRFLALRRKMLIGE